MAVAVPSTNPIYPSSTEGLIFKSKAGTPFLISGSQYIQYGAGTAYGTSTTETSLFAGNTSSFGTLTFPATGLTNDWNLPNVAGAGAMYRLKAGGIMTSTGTPTLLIRLTMTNTAGTVSELSTTGALALVAITGPATYTQSSINSCVTRLIPTTSLNRAVWNWTFQSIVSRSVGRYVSAAYRS
jgi:hypothetical protein